MLTESCELCHNEPTLPGKPLGQLCGEAIWRLNFATERIASEQAGNVKLGQAIDVVRASAVAPS